MNTEFIPIYKPVVAKNQKTYVLDCLEKNWISSRGSYINNFEEAVGRLLGVKHVVTTCNGSVSLMLSLAALGVGNKDEVITQSLTYAATVSSILNVGATPVLIDSKEDYQMNLKLIEKGLSKKTKAIIVAQLYGDSPDLAGLRILCDNEGVALIEDSAECFGCYFEEPEKRYVGSVGHCSSFSFFGNKVITAGEGGCVCTDDDDLADQLRLLKSQNHTGGFKHAGPGYNFRMTNIQAAIARAQLEELPKITARKIEIADYYRDNLDASIRSIKPKVKSTEWMPLFVLPRTLNYIKFSAELRTRGVDTRPCFTPIHLMKGFKCKKGSSLDVCEGIYEHAFNLPSYPDLTKKQLEYIIATVNEVVTKVGD
jgi:perosamine synthetase